MKITFHGAAREVTGTLYLLESEGKRILVDCGMYQGNRGDKDRNREEFPFDPKGIDALFLTHGHMDHTGRTPLLVKRGFKGPILCTEPTADIAQIIWKDTVGIARGDQRRAKRRGEEPAPLLFDESDVEKAAELLRPTTYGRSIPVGGVTAVLHDAGHILGSSFIEFRAEGRTVVFSGDLGNDDVPILRPTARLGKPDVLVIESTYGDRLHEDAETREQVLKDSVLSVAAKKGTLVIPAFAIERTQEIVLTLHRLAEAGEIPRIPIFLDSPMAIETTDVYRDHPEFYDKESHAEYVAGHRLFTLPGFQATRTVEQSKSINDARPPKVVISGSGMMTGGRIHHHLIRYLRDPNSILLIVGFQAEGTLGRELYEGARQVRIFDEDVPVRAQVKPVGAWSAHADQKKLLRWVKEAEHPPKWVLVTHGEEHAAETLARHFKRDQHVETHVPHPGETYEFHDSGLVIHAAEG